MKKLLLMVALLAGCVTAPNREAMSPPERIADDECRLRVMAHMEPMAYMYELAAMQTEYHLCMKIWHSKQQLNATD